MATNPMQRKARNSFLIGVLLTLVIAGAVITLLILQLKNYKEKEAQEEANKVNILVLSQDVISGQIITQDMLKQQVVDKNLIPSNAIGEAAILESYALSDKEGNEVRTEYKNNVATLYLTKNNIPYEIKTEEKTGNYYIEQGEQKEYVELSEDPIIAKINMSKNSVITIDAISKSTEKTTDDLRKVEYNMLTLPTQLETGEYIDIRLSLPTGQDYIVVSKKQVEIPQINGIDVDDTIWVKLTEEEIITMNNAIVEAYKIAGSQLKVITYTEAGMQSAAIPTYVPTGEVMRLIENDPNIVQQAKNALISRYNQNQDVIRNNAINPLLNNSGDEGEENVKTKVEESITNSKEKRKEYLESLGGE